MSGYRRDSPYKKVVINPQISVSHVAKLQNLLEEYDRENDFLNKQVTELLKLNKNLSYKNHYNNEHLLNKRIATEVKQKNERKNNSSKYDSYKKKYNYTGMVKDEESKKKSPTISQNKVKTQEQQNNFILEKKSVKFTRDPYIQEESNVRNTSLQSQKELRPIIKKDSRVINTNEKIMNLNKSGETSPIKKGIQLLGRSLSKEKSSQKLQSSRLSRKSSKKSGIKVYSGEKKQSEQKQQKKEQIKIQTIKEQPQILNLKAIENKNVIPNIIFTPNPNKKGYEQKIQYAPIQQNITYPQISQKIVNIPLVANPSDIQENQLNQTQKINPTYLNRDASLKNYERKASQHKIQPSQLYISSSYKSMSKGNQSQRSTSVKGKKKFLTLMSSTLISMKNKKQQGDTKNK